MCLSHRIGKLDVVRLCRNPPSEQPASDGGALENQQRFTWGGVYPKGWPEGRSELVVQCLLVEGDGEPTVDVRARFLQVVRRQLHDASGEAVDELTVGGNAS